MAQGVRRHLSKFFGGVILLLLVVGLAGFEMANFGGGVSAVGRVGDTVIDQNDYANALSQDLNAYAQQFGTSFTMAQAQQFGIDRAVLQRLVAEAALADEAARAGISVGDQRVGERVLAMPGFTGIDGRFDTAAYRAALRGSGTTVPKFEESIRAEMASGVLEAAVISGVRAPAAYVDPLINWIGEERDLAWITLEPSALEGGLPTPTEAELRAYYDANPADFTLPAARNITYVWLTPDMVMDDITIEESDLQTAYQARINEFQTPERRLVERLVFSTTEAAAEARAQIEAGEADFAALVTERGLSLADVDMGDVTQAALGAAGAEVFALPSTGIAGPVQTDLGPALFRVNAVLAAVDRSFEDARDELAQDLRMDAALRDIAAQIDVIDDLLAGGAELEDLAAETEMQLGTIRWSEDMRDGIAAHPEFVTAATEVVLNDFAEVRSLSDGSLFALRLDGSEDASLQPFDDVRADVILGWEREQTTARLNDLADTLIARLNAGESIDDLGLAPVRAPGVTRTATLPAAPGTLSEAAFAAPQGTPLRVSGDIAGQVSVFVALVEDIRAADPTSPELAGIRDTLEAQTVQSLEQDLLTAFTNAIITEIGVELRQNAINGVHASFP